MFMRKIMPFMLTVCLLLSVTACGKSKAKKPNADSAGTETSLSEVTQQPDTLPILPASTLEPEQTSAPETTTSGQPKTAQSVTTETTAYLTAAGQLTETEPVTTEGKIDRNGKYTTKDDVALYLYTYGELPSNFITKKEAQALGWSGGSLEPYAPGCCIGGTYFGNYEGALPEAPGREYHECDIDPLGKKSRGAKRIVYSNDGLIYYTKDHYKTFEKLYGEDS